MITKFQGDQDMKRAVVPLLFVCCFTMVGCMHMHNFEMQGHQITQLRSYDLLGPMTVGYYESVDGKLVLHQQAAGSVVGEIAQGVGTAVAGERIGDGLKHQEADQTNVNNEAEGGAGGKGGAGGYGAGGDGGFGQGGDGGFAQGGDGGKAYGGSATSVSGAAAGAISKSSSTSNPASYKPKPKPASMKQTTKPKPDLTKQSVSVKNTVNQ